MAFDKPVDEFELNIKTVDGHEEKWTLQPHEYLLNRRGKPIVYHDTLQAKADELGGVVSQIDSRPDYAVFHSYKSFCFVYTAFVEHDGKKYREVGEANPANLVDNPDRLVPHNMNIGFKYPSVMADKRAKDRLLIRLMGLKGQIYSDSEMGIDEVQESDNGAPLTPHFDNSGSGQPNVATGTGQSNPESDESVLSSAPMGGQDEAPISPEVQNASAHVEAPQTPVQADTTPNKTAAQTHGVNVATADHDTLKTLVVSVGKYKTTPTTLGACLENDTGTVKWLAGETGEDGRAGFKPKSSSSKQMKELHVAARVLLGLEPTAA